MEARAAFRGTRIPTGVVIAFVVALVAAILIGGLGGYALRGLSSSPSATTTTNSTSHAFVTEPSPANTSEPYRYPRAK
ncbi:MAG TPA: hypothetical protein VJQ08_05925 [Candidatus Dormibacteraeota bacterium]|nr:hypothetical protein [Candidatus Dormibacteraeota bacterium]